MEGEARDGTYIYLFTPQLYHHVWLQKLYTDEHQQIYSYSREILHFEKGWVNL